MSSTPGLELPVIADDLVLLAGGGVVVGTFPVTVLAALDRASGETRFVVEVQAEGREVFGGMPVALRDGRIAQAVSERERSLRVRTIARDGTLIADDEVVRQQTTDSLQNLLEPGPLLAIGDHEWVFCWRRGWSPYRSECRRPGDADPRWGGFEIPIAEVPGGMLVAYDERGLVHRTVEEGTALGQRLPAGDRIGAHAEGDLYLLDATARERALAEREEWDEHLGSTSELPLPMTELTARTLPEGHRRWAIPLAGDVVSMIAGPHAVCAVVTDEPYTQGRIVRIDRDGNLFGTTAVTPSAAVLARPGLDLWPTLLAIDHTHLLWASDTEIVCEVLTDPGRVVWRLPLPAPCRALREPHPIAAVLARRNIAVGGGAIVLRQRNRVWIYEERD